MGRVIATALRDAGFDVFGTSRRPVPEAAVQMLALDVRSDASVRAAIDELAARAGRLDVLVNNAAVRFLGAAEETNAEEARAVFETNFFGAHRVTTAALPLLRAAGAAKIVNIGSLSGLNALPFGSLYSASKWALEGWSESLRHELRHVGVHVSIVEPGAVHSESREAPQQPVSAIPAYDGPKRRAIAAITRGDRTGMDAARVAACVLHIVRSTSPRLRYRVGTDATWLPRLKLLYWPLYERAIRWRYALDEKDQPPAHSQ